MFGLLIVFLICGLFKLKEGEKEAFVSVFISTGKNSISMHKVTCEISLSSFISKKLSSICSYKYTFPSCLLIKLNINNKSVYYLDWLRSYIG